MRILDPEKEPDGDAHAPHHFYVGVLIATFGFASVWPYYSLTGASMALIGLLIALDDVIEHATPYATPLDLLWKHAIFPIVDRFESRAE